MNRSTLIIGIRNIWNNKVTSFINLVGLSTGIGVVLLISLYLHNEYTTDSFHKNIDNIYRFSANIFNETAYTPGPLAEMVEEKIPEVDETVRVSLTYGGQNIKCNNQSYATKGLIFADSTFFKVFSFNAIHGDLHSVLDNPGSIVLTETQAKIYFGEEYPIGKQILLNNKENITVTGIIEDISPNSSLAFNAVLSFSTLKTVYNQQYSKEWGNYNYDTFCLINKSNIREVENKINSEFHKIQPERRGSSFSLHHFKGLYLSSVKYDGDQLKHGNRQTLLFLGISGILILILAVVNFINLSLAGISKRMKAISVQMHIGARRKDILNLFLIETSVIVLLSAVSGILLSRAFLPVMNSLTGTILSNSLFSNHLFIVSSISAVAMLILVSSYIPVMVIYRSKAQLLQQSKQLFDNRKYSPKYLLVSLQFTITIVLIVSTLLMNKQISYMGSKDMGFIKENISLVWLEDKSHKKYEIFKNQLSRHSQIKEVNLSHSTPGTMGMQWGNRLTFDGETSDISYFAVPVTPGYLEMMGYKLKDGRFFNDSIGSDKECFILNEAAVKKFGIAGDPFSARINRFGLGKGGIIGVVEDFHFQSLHEKIRPMAFCYPNGEGYCSLVSIKTASDSHSDNTQLIEKDFREIYPNAIFNCFTIGDRMSEYYLKESNLNRMISLFSIISIIIGCLGLLGIVNISIVTRIKEIGVRKINGAKVSEILQLLNRDFIIWVGIAYLVACPVAYYTMTKWLQNFAYKTPLSWWIFALAGVLALGIALLTVSMQSWKAATRNPVEALRYE